MGTPPVSGRGSLRGRLFCVLPALGVLVVQLGGSAAVDRHQTGHPHLNAFGWLLLVIGPALLVLRRRMPAVAVYGAAAAALTYLAAGFANGPVFISPVVAFFSAVLQGRRRHAWAALGGLYAGHLVLSRWLVPPRGVAAADAWVVETGIAAWLLVIGAAAELARTRRERIERARRERAEAEQRRAGEERLRIARELHDVVAHSLSVINVQAGMGLALFEEHPEQAHAALDAIRTASKEALGEVRQVLAALRAPDAAPREPALGLSRLPELAEQAQAAGLRVEMTVGESAAPLPPGVDLAAFRIVQEALTNIIRHSRARTARVRVERRAEAVAVTVEDDGPAAGRNTGSGGNGLVGMRERAAGLGGTVTAGPRGDGGWRVAARLPLARGGHQ